MTNKVTLVTSPDDVSIDAVRILCVDLNPQQSQLVSNVLTGIEEMPETVLYIWNSQDDAKWLFDKKQKSNLILFNAEGFQQEVVGYFAAQRNSFYFGQLRTLHHVNCSSIQEEEVLLTIIKETYQKNEI